MEDLQARHKKEIKTLEADKRTAIKKIKGTAGKGKKGKEILAAAEAEWDEKYKVLLQKHEEEMAAVAAVTSSTSTIHMNDLSATSAENATTKDESKEIDDTQVDADELARQKALAKKLRKKQAKLEKELAREEEIARQMANAPNPRQIEIDAIMELYLNQEQMEIEEVKADGNCLYRAIARQMEILGKGDYDYEKVRALCSEEMMKHRDEYEPFADLHEMDVSSFEEYVEKVKCSNEWGGHLELRALAHGLKKVIKVYSTEGPLEIKSDGVNEEDGTITLSFHRNYYALGEHYNSVVKK
jgi:OTU domain-containing protein 6